jgi:hypothetical protein
MNLDYETGIFYIIREREFEKTNENIYRIGKTISKNYKEIFKKYPYHTKIYGYWNCKNINKFSKMIQYAFNIKFIKKNNIGKKYYEGNIEEMIKSINYLYQEFN